MFKFLYDTIRRAVRLDHLNVKKVPIIGKCPRKKFQSLELFGHRFSNDWNFLRWALGGVLLVGGFAAAVQWGPFPEERLARYPASVVMTDRDGGVLRVRLGTGDLDCRPVYVPDREDWIVQAVIAAEDQRFWTHAGLDPLALARAVRQNLGSGRRISGASTISTQVIRLLEPRPRTMTTKLVEAFRALQLERRQTKEEILAQYLNRAPFGGNIVGIEAAAQRYFGKNAKQLSLAEASLLAGLPQSPSRLRPDRHRDRALRRQQYVLDRMVALGTIAGETAQVAYREAMVIPVRPNEYPLRAPHFTEWAALRPTAIVAGQPVRTSLDPGLQSIAEETLRRHLAGRPTAFGAVVILDVTNSAVRAMVGSPDFFAADIGQVNGALAERAAGSTLKPFAYALGMDRGLMIPQTVLTDVPTRFRDFEPGNFNPTYRGLVTLHDALVLSLNLPAIEVVREVGMSVFHGTLRSLGLDTVREPVEHYGVGLVLGNTGVRLLDLANAYACLARGGVYRSVRSHEDAPADDGVRIFSEEAAWLIADMLSGDERAMDTTGHTADVRLPRMAWKTGTSAGLRDAWTVAYNPHYVIGVWIGQPDGSSAEGLVGRAIATPLAWALLRQIYPASQGPWYERPEGIEACDVCAVSGRPLGAACGHGIAGWRIRGVTRYRPCPAHGGHRVAATTERTLVEAPLKITSPASGTVYHYLDDWGSAHQQLALQASGPGGELFWFINDRLIGQSAPGQSFFWPLQRGQHQIVCSSAHGHTAHAVITVQ